MSFLREDRPVAAKAKTQHPAEPAARVMIGRQPILDRRRQVLGYELLFNAASTIDAADVTAETAAAHVIADGILSMGLDRLVGTRRAFIELPPAFLRHDVMKVLPPSKVVIEIASNSAPDAQVADACRNLKEAGYALALKNFSPDAMALLPVADFLKRDFMATDPRGTQACLEAGRTIANPPGVIATNVDAVEVFDEALREGFSHAQGYFFTRDAAIPTRAIPRGQVGSLRLLCALSDPNLSLNNLEDLLKHDASLCYRMLRTVNSAGFAQSREVTSIRQALLLMGRDTIRRWTSLWVMGDLGAGAHAELVTMASIRGRFCELISARKHGPEAGGEGFLLGMCSCLDVILQRPMTAIIEELPMSAKVMAALVGRDNPARQLLDCIIAYERGDWTTSLALADVLEISHAWLPPAHAEALGWVSQMHAPPATGLVN